MYEDQMGENSLLKNQVDYLKEFNKNLLNENTQLLNENSELSKKIKSLEQSFQSQQIE